VKENNAEGLWPTVSTVNGRGIASNFSKPGLLSLSGKGPKSRLLGSTGYGRMDM